MQAGMPKKLRTLVDLEALLNDGTAYVLFVLLRVSAQSCALADFYFPGQGGWAFLL